MRKLLALALITASCPVMADDDGIDYGNGFLASCDQPTSTLMYCVGFIRGLRTAPAPFAPTKPTDSLHRMVNNAAFCFPARSTDGQVLETLVAYLKANPSVRHYPIYALYAKAMNDVWPCDGGPDVVLGGEGYMKIVPKNKQ